MSTLADFIRSSMRQLHGSYNDAIGDLSLEQLHWRANDRGCPIAFVLWHYYRTEDNVIQFERKPTRRRQVRHRGHYRRFKISSTTIAAVIPISARPRPTENSAPRKPFAPPR